MFHYSVPNTCLLRENFPFDEKHKVTYLASEEQANVPNAYSYLWPYSGTFSAVNALFEATQNKEFQKLLDERVLPGLDEYFDTARTPKLIRRMCVPLLCQTVFMTTMYG